MWLPEILNKIQCAADLDCFLLLKKEKDPEITVSSTALLSLEQKSKRLLKRAESGSGLQRQR